MALHAIVVLTASLRDAKRRDWHRDAQLTAQRTRTREERKEKKSRVRESRPVLVFPSEDIGGKKNTNENESRGYEWPTRKTPSSTAPQRHTLNVCEY
ncbi:hypothetical protein COCC4DRAFT_30460 [Bipolaris maydis ATCC 48331]|uniref:Uncharacterized protein n=2 Tax=Cochliobolus heterostrophus TaxID=5016 RepID=M2UUG7_COCH5|nr:uncharacterized protein COCC4DRAFT_30460 [Bipolaris maydis ATCC 48331]EMD91512.1 hypothetical protein COCHEDRAFT_1021479 [Bipolaris maydis C5]ENI08730.1 hypothetical protein COCC4DRAFT_30460 [Bipolaris maydis ATCC 48331]